MQSAGTAPDGAVDLSDLAPVLDTAGPFISVYLTTEGGIDNAGRRSQQRWGSLRSGLEDQGAPETALDRVEALIDDAHERGESLAVIADASAIHLVEHFDEPLDIDRGSWSPVPDLVPLTRWRQSHIPYVLAFADKGGADLIAVRPEAPDLEREAGDGEPASKVGPGGFSQRRYQQRADEDWAKTATEVAEEIRELAEQIGAVLVIVGGDVTASHLIAGALPSSLSDHTHLIDQGRAEDGSEPVRDREVRRLVDTAVAAQTVALLEKFKEECGQKDRAVDGVAATIDALNQAAVDVLFVHDDRTATAWVGQSAIPVSLERDTDLIHDEPLEVPLSDALVRAAVGTGATVRVIPEAGPVTDGIGAILRWANEPE